MLNLEKREKQTQEWGTSAGFVEKNSKKNLSENPLDQEVFIDFHHETLGGFLCIFFRWWKCLEEIPRAYE